MEGLKQMVSKYGWGIQQRDGRVNLYNQRGDITAIIIIKNGKYKILNSDCLRIMLGDGNLVADVEKLLTQYFQCTPILRETLI